MKKIVIFFAPIAVFILVQSTFAKSINIPLMTSPQIDGILMSGEWDDASQDTGFVQLEPNKGEFISEKTTVYIGMDKSNLYVAFRNEVKDPSSLSAGNNQRDQSDLFSDDGVLLQLDSFHDKRSAYVFHLNMLGTQSDQRIENNGGSSDKNWDTKWKSAVSRDDTGWIAEMVIPFRSIKYSSKKVWGINFARAIARNQEVSWWSGALDDYYRISQSGEMIFVDQLPRELSPVSIIPYGNVYKTKNEDVDGGIGVDGEVPITSDLAFNFTVNPDFASVEGDQKIITVDPWEINFPEKRPFFRDINALFDVRYDPFYSRRIGDIQHGEKLYGKVGKYQVAGLFARTNEIKTDGEETSPQANFSVLRVQKDILAASTLGLTITEKAQKGSDTKRIYNVDTEMRLPYQIYTTGQFLVATSGSEEFDFKNSMGGFLRIAKETNRYHVHTRLTSFGNDMKENMNSTGFLKYDNVIELDKEFWYKYFPKSGGTIKQIFYGGNYKWDWSQDRELKRFEIRQESNVYFKNRFSIESDYTYEYRDINDPEWGDESQTHHYKRVFDVGVGYNMQEWSYVNVEFDGGQTFDGQFIGIAFETQFKVFDKISINYELGAKKYDWSGADTSAVNVIDNVLGADVYFTRDLFARIFTQYLIETDNHFYKEGLERFYIYALFGWRFSPPNSAIYLTVSNDDRDVFDEKIERPGFDSEWKVFLKLSHEFSLPRFW